MRIDWKAILFMNMALMMMSCNSDFSEEKYIKWIENPVNGLHSVKKMNELVYDLQFQPTAYLWLQSERSISYDSAMLSNKGVQQYLLKITSRDAETDWLKSNYDEITFQKRAYYFSYLFQNDISITEDEVVLPCVLYHFEQSQSTTASRTFLLGFENKFSSLENVVLSIHSEMISTLPVKIKISKQNIPNLKI